MTCCCSQLGLRGTAISKDTTDTDTNLKFDMEISMTYKSIVEKNT